MGKRSASRRRLLWAIAAGALIGAALTGLTQRGAELEASRDRTALLLDAERAARAVERAIETRAQLVEAAANAWPSPRPAELWLRAVVGACPDAAWTSVHVGDDVRSIALLDENAPAPQALEATPALAGDDLVLGASIPPSTELRVGFRWSGIWADASPPGLEGRLVVTSKRSAPRARKGVGSSAKGVGLRRTGGTDSALVGDASARCSGEVAVPVLLRGQGFTLLVRRPEPTVSALAVAGLGFALGAAAVTTWLVSQLLWCFDEVAAAERHRLAVLHAAPDPMIRLGPDGEVAAHHRWPVPSEGGWMPDALRRAVAEAVLTPRMVELEVMFGATAYDVRIVPEPDGHVLLSLRDVTLRQRLAAERDRLARLAESSAELAAVLTLDGRFEYLNPSGRRMLGVENGPLPRFEAWVAGPTAAWSGRHHLPGPGGIEIPVYLTSFPLDTPEGPRRGLIALDLRETVELERQITAKHKFEAVGTLAAGVAHDFHNALAVLKCSLQLIETHPDVPKDAAPDLQAMRSALEQATRLSRQLLGFARPRAVAPFLLDEALEASKALLSQTAGRDATLRWSLGAERARLLGDPGALQQALLNLVQNARDAGGAEIVISTSLAGPRAIIEVRDDGAGIPESDRVRVFDPFFTTKSAGHGTGLGLTMVRRVVHDLGGDVDLSSAPGGGTTVRLRLPCRRLEQPGALRA